MTNERVRRHPEEFRRIAVERFKSCDNVALLSRELGVPRQTLYRWIEESERVEVREDGEQVPTVKSRESRLRKRVDKLKGVIADKTLEVDFFKGALQRVEAQHRDSNAGGELAFTTTSGT
jgi:transposase-like protein